MTGADVYLWGSRIGTVVQEDYNDTPRFNYDDVFIRSGIEVSPLTMPLSGQVYSFPALNRESFYGLPGLLSDSLPDRFGTSLLTRYLADRGRSMGQVSAVERLCYTGSRGMGALEYRPAMDIVSTEDERLDVDQLVKVASDILTHRQNISISTDSASDRNVMQQIMRVGTSAGGARAKAVVAWNREKNEIRSGQTGAGAGFEYYIIKFDGVSGITDHGEKKESPAYTRIEYAYHLMARDCGITMNFCELFRESGLYHFLTKRFDRVGKSGSKLHMQTLGAIAHYDFNNPGANSYEQAAQVIYKLGMSQPDIEQLFRRMVFNVLGANNDDHVKNISFLMDRTGKWSLSPAYDLTFAFNPENRWLRRHQMSINGKLDGITLQDMTESGSRMNISRHRILSIISDVASSVSRWLDFAETAGVPEAQAGFVSGHLRRQNLSQLQV